MRVWHGQDAVLAKMGGPGLLISDRLTLKAWQPVLPQPKYAYCFGEVRSGESTFSSYRFMLRSAYIAGIDVHMYVTPLNGVPRAIIDGVGLGERYEFWLRELVRINEEEARRAGHKPFALWDFSDINSITSEPVPPSTDPRPMRWFWELSHFRKETGDLILDRLFDYRTSSRELPADFGVLLTGATVDNHIKESRQRLDKWFSDNPALGARIRTETLPGPRNRQSEATCW
jgi:hypothetical protein